MDLEQFRRLRVGMFSQRASMKEALDMANQLAQACENPAAVLTAVHVVLNTAIDLLDPESYNGHPNYPTWQASVWDWTPASWDDVDLFKDQLNDEIDAMPHGLLKDLASAAASDIRWESLLPAEVR